MCEVSNLTENTCCFFGHRIIKETDELRRKITEAVEGLITNEKVDTFLFGSKSRFDSLGLELVTKLKKKYPHVKLIYVRAEFPYINDDYNEYLQRVYDDTYYPEGLIRAGRAVYVERNRKMIDKSRFCIVYYDEANAPTTRKSGTKAALDYAVKKGKVIITFPDSLI